MKTTPSCLALLPVVGMLAYVVAQGCHPRLRGDEPNARKTTREESAKSGEPAFPYELVEGEPMYTVVPMDAIPAVDEPVFVSAVQADSFMQPEEPVLGVVGRDGTAKAYSAWQLEGHEIVNDVLDGEPIAATW